MRLIQKNQIDQRYRENKLVYIHIIGKWPTHPDQSNRGPPFYCRKTVGNLGNQRKNTIPNDTILIIYVKSMMINNADYTR